MSIVKEIESYIRSGETDKQDLGLEIEHFVVDDKGQQIGFHEVSALIKDMAVHLNAEIIYMDGFPVGYKTGEYSVTLEPACQFEISINPYSDLDTIKSIYEGFIDLWTPVFASRGYRIITGGNLPDVERGVVDPADIPLSPKKRYKYMNAHFEKTGRYGKHMMRASSSTQVSVDFSSEEDLVRKLRVLQKISPVLMIGMENKADPESALKGTGRKHLHRIQQWDDLDPDRTGFYPGSFDKDFGYEKIAKVIAGTPLILLTDNGETEDVGYETADSLIKGGRLVTGNRDKEDLNRLIEHFISMGFFHFRVKKYIEIRVADSVPLDRALGYVALLKGIIYSDSNLARLEDELADIDSEDKIQSAVDAVKADGYDAVIYNGRKASCWASELAELAAGQLEEKDREYLERVRTFWGEL